MVDILEFASGSKIIVIDRVWYLTYGKKPAGYFTISFKSIYSQLFRDVTGVVDKVEIVGDNLIVTRVKDYDGEVLVYCDNLPDVNRVGCIFSTFFDAYETLIVVVLANYLPDVDSIGVGKLVDLFKETGHDIGE